MAPDNSPTYGRPSFEEPTTDQFLYAGWRVDPPTRLPIVRRSDQRERVIERCRAYTAATERQEGVVSATVYETQMIPPLPGMASARHIEAMYVEWRRMLGTGTRRRQNASRTLEAQTRVMRWYEPVLIPGMLHTADYATAVMRRVIDFYGIPDDLGVGVAARMQRQQALYQGDHRYHLVLAEQALHTVVGDRDVMAGQLDRLLAAMSLPRVMLGIVPASSKYRVPANQFIMFDNRLVHVETISAELAISQPREIALYGRAFAELAAQAVTGAAARDLIAAALSVAMREDD